MIDAMEKPTLTYAGPLPPVPRKIGRLTLVALALSILSCPFLVDAGLRRLPASVARAIDWRRFEPLIMTAAGVISLVVTLIAAGRANQRRERIPIEHLFTVVSFVFSFSWAFILGYVWWNHMVR
jgi:hypothetical protein